MAKLFHNRRNTGIRLILIALGKNGNNFRLHCKTLYILDNKLGWASLWNPHYLHMLLKYGFFWENPLSFSLSKVHLKLNLTAWFSHRVFDHLEMSSRMHDFSFLSFCWCLVLLVWCLDAFLHRETISLVLVCLLICGVILIDWDSWFVWMLMWSLEDFLHVQCILYSLIFELFYVLFYRWFDTIFESKYYYYILIIFFQIDLILYFIHRFPRHNHIWSLS